MATFGEIFNCGVCCDNGTIETPPSLGIDCGDTVVATGGYSGFLAMTPSVFAAIIADPTLLQDKPYIDGLVLDGSIRGRRDCERLRVEFGDATPVSITTGACGYSSNTHKTQTVSIIDESVVKASSVMHDFYTWLGCNKLAYAFFRCDSDDLHMYGCPSKQVDATILRGATNQAIEAFKVNMEFKTSACGGSDIQAPLIAGAFMSNNYLQGI